MTVRLVSYVTGRSNPWSRCIICYKPTAAVVLVDNSVLWPRCSECTRSALDVNTKDWPDRPMKVITIEEAKVMLIKEAL